MECEFKLTTIEIRYKQSSDIYVKSLFYNIKSGRSLERKRNKRKEEKVSIGGKIGDNIHGKCRCKNLKRIIAIPLIVILLRIITNHT